MKKKLAAVFLAAIMILSLAGCKSTLRPALEEYNRKMNIGELDLSILFDEQNGFHYKDITWGMTLDEARKASDSSIGSILGYGPNDIIIYESDLAVQILGRRNDSASIGTILEQSDCYMISFAFNQDSKKLPVISEQELFDQYLVTLKEKFGDPSDYKEDTRTSDRVSTLSKSYLWDYTTPDGKKTELQWSAAYVSGAEAPSIVTLGVVYFHEALEETESAAE